MHYCARQRKTTKTAPIAFRAIQAGRKSTFINALHNYSTPLVISGNDKKAAKIIKPMQNSHLL
jgi:hypothetical protein